MKSSTSTSDSAEATDEKWTVSKEERVATWHFVMLDKNKNKVLERKEWKSFRTMVANNRHLRRCGKKLPRYCDINNDRRISMTEWLSCLNAQRPTPGTSYPTYSKFNLSHPHSYYIIIIYDAPQLTVWRKPRQRNHEGWVQIRSTHFSTVTINRSSSSSVRPTSISY